MTHVLKCWLDPFQAILDGLKTFEWRRNDRGFEVTDELRLRECDPQEKPQNKEDEQPAVYSGRELTCKVTYILRGPLMGVPLGWVIMGIGDVREWTPVLTEAETLAAGATDVGP